MQKFECLENSPGFRFVERKQIGLKFRVVQIKPDQGASQLKGPGDRDGVPARLNRRLGRADRWPGEHDQVDVVVFQVIGDRGGWV